MRFSIHTLGTRGDLQPYLALARSLGERGHSVLIVAPEQFGGMVQEVGAHFAPLPAAFLDMLETPEAKEVIGASKPGFGAGLKLIRHYRDLTRQVLDIEWKASRDFSPDAVLYHPKALGAAHVATRLDVPSFLASPLPGFTPTSAFPTPVLPFADLGPLNKASHGLMIHGGRILFAKEIRRWRAEALDLPPRGRAKPDAGTIYGYSQHVLARPDDWGKTVAVTGYWFLDSPHWVPDAALAAFLAAGDRPVYAGFGSMPGSEPRELTRRVVEGLRQAGKRGVIAMAGGAMCALEAMPDMHFIAGAPHDQLFPLMQGTLHHGGAGTTGAALRAGHPTIICPFLGDQPFWARRVAALGAGPPPLDKRTMSVGDIASAVRAIDNPEMRRRAAVLGEKIRTEDGVGAAIDFIEGHLKQAA